MQHAGDAALDTLEKLLRTVRTSAALTEKKRGVFSFRSSAFLHFHEDPAGLFADVRLDRDWRRFPVNTRAERVALLAQLKAVLPGTPSR